ncbi:MULTISPECIES: FeoA family protein [Persicobacter]|uniref:Iron transporter FeoA n=1 Tax=Persicobacter diffluens TaxID=981 RepID=A0AAN4VVL1_9BACT|nr:FeoA family protein [Persicobacter sp. CCB-QB2]GJM59625.1 iron transporter FeoA [Persicobacter diffluens]
MNIADLKIGQKGIVTGFSDEELSLRLLDMGCLPGEEITLSCIAPLGDPIAIDVAGSRVSLRKKEASTVMIEKIS